VRSFWLGRSCDNKLHVSSGYPYLSEALRKKTIALARRDDGNWAIRFRNFDLGTLTEEGNVFWPVRLSWTLSNTSVHLRRPFTTVRFAESSLVGSPLSPPQHLRHPSRQRPPNNLEAPETPTKRRLLHRAAGVVLAGPPGRARLTARFLPLYSVT
jgi:hypothetical protein